MAQARVPLLFLAPDFKAGGRALAKHVHPAMRAVIDQYAIYVLISSGLCQGAEIKISGSDTAGKAFGDEKIGDVFDGFFRA